MLNNQVIAITMESAHNVMEVSQGENMLQVSAQANQMNLLAHNVDHLQIASGSVNNNSGSSNLEENVVQVEEVVRGEEVIQAEEERAVIELQNERMNEYVVPGCHKCLQDDSCNSPNCEYCTRGFCHKGQLCKNIYSHFAMCGRETNYCKDYRMRGSRNGRRFQN